MSPSAATEPGLVDVAGLADRILQRVRQFGAVWGPYSLDLTFDAMLEYARAANAPAHRTYVMDMWARRAFPSGEYTGGDSLPFVHLSYSIFRHNGDRRVADAFVQETRWLQAQVDRSADGLVLHRTGRGELRVLVDSMQDYIARMARAGTLTGEADFFAEAADQASRHRDLLRDVGNGLWRQGRGWEPADPRALSPYAWSRGQGWILRGLLDALDAIPSRRTEAGVLRSILCELLDALMPRQAESGLWHCLVDQAWDQSAPETSGSALIASALYRSLAAGHIEGERYRVAADRALAALSSCVEPDGCVTGACIGPGPLTSQLAVRYRGATFTEAEDHGRFSMLYALAARANWLRVTSDQGSRATTRNPTWARPTLACSRPSMFGWRVR